MNNVGTRLCRPTRSTAPVLVPLLETLTGSTQFHVDNGGTRLRVPVKEQSSPWQRAQTIRQMVPQVSLRAACTKSQPQERHKHTREFFTGFQRLTGTEISAELRKDVDLVSAARRRYA